MGSLELYSINPKVFFSFKTHNSVHIVFQNILLLIAQMLDTFALLCFLSYFVQTSPLKCMQRVI